MLHVQEVGEHRTAIKKHQRQGWNEYCKELHLAAREAFIARRGMNSPRTGTVFTFMSQTRARLKRAL